MDIACVYENRILDLLPDGVLAADRDLIIRQINPAACRLLGIQDPAEYIGSPVSRVMDDTIFLKLRDEEEMQHSDFVVLRGESIQIERSFCCDADRTLCVCIMHEMAKRQLYEDLLRCQLHAAELADTICEKQLNIVSEIAGMLGEAAVETQATVQELKKALLPDKVEKNG